MEKEVYSVIGEDRDSQYIKNNLTKLFESKGISQFKIKYDYVFDSPGLDIDVVSVSWVDESGLNLVTTTLKSY